VTGNQLVRHLPEIGHFARVSRELSISFRSTFPHRAPPDELTSLTPHGTAVAFPWDRVADQTAPVSSPSPS